jgi:hypothetical protein
MEFLLQPTLESTEIPLARAIRKKGRRLLFPSPATVVKIKASRPFTRSSSKKETVEKEFITEASIKRKDKGKIGTVEKRIDFIDITNPPKNHTFKRLIKQLREARKDISHLKGEGLAERKKMKDLMDVYLETIDKANFTTRIFLPLHRQLKNLYKKNKDFQS